MSSLYRKGDKQIWTISYFDADGRRCERSSRTSDKRTAERIARQIEEDVALERAGVVSRQDRAGAAAAQLPASQHLARYLEEGRNLGHSAKRLDLKRRYVGEFLAHARIDRVRQLNAIALQGFLDHMRQRGMAASSRNDARAACVAFANWLVKVDALSAHTLGRAARANVDTDRRMVRRPLTDAEIGRLLRPAEVTVVAARPGPFDLERAARRLVYATALGTGLRHKEIGQLRWSDLDLVARTMAVRATVSKSRKAVVLPLDPTLAVQLEGARPPRPGREDLVFVSLPTSRTVQADFRRAGIPELDADGRRVDFHSLRGTFATRLVRAGVSALQVKRLMRHAKIETTEKHYISLQVEDLRSAIEALPSLPASTPARLAG